MKCAASIEPFANVEIFMNRCVSGPSPEQLQPKKPSLASRLSEKFQASLSTQCETDDDFQPDRKRIRTAELKVAIKALYILNKGKE